nr:transposase [Photorhabdus laumondii]
MYGNKGYISQVRSDELAAEKITLVRNILNNMKIKAFYLWGRLILSKKVFFDRKWLWNN